MPTWLLETDKVTVLDLESEMDEEQESCHFWPGVPAQTKQNEQEYCCG
jgi:hypothetical protein